MSLLVPLALGHVLRVSKAVDESLYLEEVAPSEVFGDKAGSPPHYRSAAGTVAFNSYDVIPSIRGYAGPIKLLIALDPKGVISGIRVLEHKETPNYVHRMDKPEFLGQFLGKSVNEPIELDEDIDGISRATVSVKALADTVRVSSRQVAGGVMGMKVLTTSSGGGSDARWLAYAIFFSAAFSLYLLSRRAGYGRRLQPLRDVALAVSIVIVGLWLSSPFSALHFLNLVLLGLSRDRLLIAVFISVIVSLLIAGRFYCGWICPFGALSEFIGRLPVRKWEFSTEADDRGRKVKYALFAFVMALVAFTGKTGYGNFETYVTLFSYHGSVFTWALVALGLLANLRVRRFWCRYLCPVGALTGSLSRVDSRYVSSADCPIGNKPNPRTSECIRCNRCYKPFT